MKTAMKTMYRVMAITCGLLAAGVVADGALNSSLLTLRANAVVGRPATIVVEGASIYQCGSTYYQPYGNQYEVVYID